MKENNPRAIGPMKRGERMIAATGSRLPQDQEDRVAPRRNGETLLRLEAVSKVFTTDEVETHALSGIELEIRKGEYVSIAGPSGCGKSTLLSILGLLDSPTEGRYWLKSQPVGSLKL